MVHRKFPFPASSSRAGGKLIVKKCPTTVISQFAQFTSHTRDLARQPLISSPPHHKNAHCPMFFLLLDEDVPHSVWTRWSIHGPVSCAMHFLFFFICLIKPNLVRVREQSLTLILIALKAPCLAEMILFCMPIHAPSHHTCTSCPK